MTRPNIAFYAPLKSPLHPVPSGDRLMARQLLAALGAGAQLASELRSYLRDPWDGATAIAAEAEAEAEIARISRTWRDSGPPALWFCYHPYYKAPDLIGPRLCARFHVPYVTVESSLSARRDIGHWVKAQVRVREGAAMAALNICLTRRDLSGLHQACPGVKTAMLRPFIDPAPFLQADPTPEPGRLICVAMMRPGDKLDSYAVLAAALGRIMDLPWRLSVIGDGEARDAVRALFAPMAARVDWQGALPREAIAQHLSRASVYVWPGCGEAYGLTYLEAQAAGLPVVALRVAGVPEVVTQGEGGVLTDPSDIAAYAAAIRGLLGDTDLRQRSGTAARSRAVQAHSLISASARLNDLLAPVLDQTP